MQTKTKKIVAKEIIILFSVLILSILFFFGNLLYNNFLSRRVSQYDKARLIVARSIDSLQRAVKPLLNDNRIYNFFKANNLTEKDEELFLNTYKNPDSAKLIYNFMRANKLTDLSGDSFYNKYLSQLDADMYFQIQSQLKLKEGELNVIRAKQLATQNEVLTRSEIRRNIIWFLAILFTVVYFLRPSVKVIKWAFQTLRD